MCDELTQGHENEQRAPGVVSRREFTALGAGAATVALSGCSGMTRVRQNARELAERTVQVTTADGIADGFFVHPAKGSFPGVLMWPDVGGLRESFRIMARQLADSGFAVLAVNQYYRAARAPVLTSFAEWRTPSGQERLRPMIAAVTSAATIRDALAFTAFLDGQPAVDTSRRIGTCGYCMGGPAAVRTAAAGPTRVGAAASFHGANLVSDDPDSPVNLIARTQAAFLFAIARNDDARQPEAKSELKAACDAARLPAEVEVYPADHGWCVPDNPSYDPNAADKAWQRMEALLARL
ncbi:MAG: dienelactone hydrolase family protein [Novosphingobium sp.]